VIKEMDLISIDKIETPDFLENPEAEVKAAVWFIVRKITEKVSKANKPYLELVVNGENFSDKNLKIWSVPQIKTVLSTKQIDKDMIMCGEVSLNKYGLSAFYKNLGSLSDAYDYMRKNHDETELEIG